MGVTGLWRLIEPAGKPVPVETLENKVLAVDISIWLHQMVKGYQDAKGAPIANAHLMGLFQRLCKLLYFRIKPVFVFDGAFPDLKRETIAKRQDNKSKYNSESERLKRELALLLTKKTAISGLLGKDISPKKSGKPADDDDLFKLPALPQREESESESEEETSSSSSTVDLHSVDVESEKFKSLPIKDKYDLLIELKETRKMNSWGRLHELPKKSDNFSDFQLQRLLKRRKVQECLEETEKEMGDGGMSLIELESLLNDEGIDTKIETLPSRRIASDNRTRFLLINDVKQALAEAKKKEAEARQSTSKETSIEPVEIGKKDELEEDLEKAIKMSLGCVNAADISAGTSKTDESWTSYASDIEYSSDSEDEDGYQPPDMSTARAYIMQYSDFTNNAIDDIVSTKTKSKAKAKPKVNQILEEINKERSVILDKLELSSDEEIDDKILVKANSSDVIKSSEEQDDDVIELDTTIDSIPSDGDIVATQASVICVENPVEEVTLDSSLEESPNSNEADIETNKNNPEHTINSPVNIVSKNSPLSNVDSSKSNENVTNLIEDSSKTDVKPQLVENTDTDSSDDDFEDVPEPEQNKTVVQLTLNMNGAPDDDIFADVFENDVITKNVLDESSRDIKCNNDVISSHECVTNSEGVSEAYHIENEMDDDELQRAIQMSLECEANAESPTISTKTPETVETITPKDKAPVDNVPKETVTQKPLEKPISKTLLSLQEIEKSQLLRKQSQNTDEINQIKQQKKIVSEPISIEKLNNMVEEISTAEEGLMQEKGRLDRVGRNITEQMTKEAQELLQLFGIPYIVAPMEAEAQCAFLESVKLTDGTITDDSDIWLFGGKTVYKNFFNQKKHVLQFLSERIERSFNLNREQLILLALLVGSDYTVGVSGVGPVTALEILASFPFNKKKLQTETTKHDQYLQIVTGLQEFKRWVKAGKRTDNTSLKKKLRNVDVNDDFPSVRVVQAYLEPNIEKSEDKFSWGEIDVNILREYTRKKFGWSQNKLDEIIKPVLKRLAESKNQKSIADYFKKKVDFQCLEELMSKRVKAAVQKMGPETTAEDQELQTIGTNEEVATKPQRKRKVKEKGIRAEIAGPSRSKQKKTEDILKDQTVKVVSVIDKDGKSDIDIKIRKTDRFQEIIPQREKDKQSLLQNKMKAIELFRKTNIDKKKKVVKRKAIVPKADAELSESSDSD